MSVLALTTAVVVAAAPVPGGATPAPVVATGYESVALVAAPESAPTTAPADPAQSPAPPPSTGPAQPAEAAPAAPIEYRAPTQATGQGEIVVTGRRANPGDPLEDLNATSFEVAQSVDKSIVAPVAFAYGEVVPRPVRKGLSNFLHNLSEPIIFLNFMLQLKPGKAAETLGRFAINTTLGLGGVVDVAKREPFNLPFRRNGFANTLGYYGVKPGPYFYLPLIGPTTLRDFIGDRVDMFILPTFYPRSLQRPAIVIPVAVMSELGRRIDFDDELREIRATRDPYVAARTHYLQKRQAEIDALHGRGPATVGVGVPAPASGNPAPAAPAPVQDSPPKPGSTGQ